MAKKQNITVIMLILLGGIILSLPYLVQHTGLLMLMALVPLFQLTSIIEKRGIKRGWLLYYSMFFLWNLLSTYWIYKATFAGAVAAILLNSMQMTIVYSASLWFRKRAGKALGYSFLIVAWLAWEHFYYNAEISWPWLTLGNGLATTHKNIQWYEYTGVLGGSLWILVTNIMIFEFTGIVSRVERWVSAAGKSISKPERAPVKRGKTKRELILFILTLIVIHTPFVYSQIMYDRYKERKNGVEVVVLQPNIDPYADKFGGMSQYEQDIKLLEIASRGVTKNTKLIVAPETFTSYVVENMPEKNSTVLIFQDFLRSYPNSSMLFGATTYNFYTENGSSLEQRPNYTARKSGDGTWYDAFNSAIYMDSTGVVDIYHKSKLVVMVEMLPYPKYLPFLSSLSVNLGGISGSLAKQKEREVFESPLNRGLITGAAICYESVFGDFYRDYVLKGANMMSIITNDGWWGDTPGYRQHLRYAQLRAIETRRSIARSANTGISAIIDQRGDIVQQSSWWSEAYLRGELNLNDKITIFVKYGDYIGRVAQFAIFLFLGLALLLVMRIYGRVRQ